MFFLLRILILFCIYNDSVSFDRPMVIPAKQFQPEYLSTSPKLSPASIWILHSKRVNWCFCTPRKVSLQIINIDYSNDGDSDMVSVFLDMIKLGTFTTYMKSRDTQEWKMFFSSGPLNFNQGFTNIDAGSHNITVEFTKGNGKALELKQIDLTIRSPIPQAKIIFNKGCQAKKCLASPVSNSWILNKLRSGKEKKKENMLPISELEEFDLESQNSEQKISVQMSPTFHYGGSFTYRHNGRGSLAEECKGCFLAVQKRKPNPCSKEEKVKIELYTKSPTAYRIRMADESVQLCQKKNLSLFSVHPENAACNISSTLNDKKWLFYSVSKPLSVFPNVINATINTTYVLSFTLENHKRVLYSEYRHVKLTVVLANINNRVEFINISASLNWVILENSSRIFTRAKPNQEWEFPFKKLIPGANFIILDFRGGRISHRVCLDLISLSVSIAPPITKTLFRKNRIKIVGHTEIGKSIPKMWVHILGTHFKEFASVNTLQFSVFSNISNQFVPLIVLTAGRKLYVQTLSRNPDYSTSSYFEIGHQMPTPGTVRFTVSSVYVNPLNNVWEVVFNGGTSSTMLRIAHTKTMTDVIISKQNYRISIPTPAFRLLPIVVFQAKWLEDNSCKLYAVNNNTKSYKLAPPAESTQPPVIEWEQVYAKQFTIYGAQKPSPTSTYRRPPRFNIEPLTARQWNSLPLACFPPDYNLDVFKSNINKLLTNRPLKNSNCVPDL